MKKIKVLHIIWALGIGGAERVVANYAKFYDHTRYEVSVCCLTKGGPLVEEIKRQGVKVFILNKKKGIDLLIIPKLIKLIKQEDIQIAHTHNFTANSWGRVAAVFSKLPVIVSTEHNVVMHDRGCSCIIDKFLSNFTDKIIAVSNQVRLSHIEKHKIPPEKILTIYNGIDPVPFEINVDKKKLLPEIGIPDGLKIIGAIGSLTSQKAHNYFLQAAKIISKKNSNVIFMVIGDGPLREELKRLSNELKISDKVIFTGQRKDIPQLLHLIDVFVLSSLWEGFPITLLEAMAARKSVVVTDVGGNREAIIDGKTGFLVPSKEPASLAQAVLLFIRNDQLALNMGLEGEKHLKKNFLASKMVEKTEKIYKSLYYANKKISNHSVPSTPPP